MALRLPTAHATRTRVVLRFRDTSAAAEVGDLGGPRFVVHFEDGTSLTTTVEAVGGTELLVEGVPEPGTRQPSPGEHVIVSWTELNDLAKVRGEIEEAGPDELAVRCAWPPVREQRRAFRRFRFELPVWTVRTAVGGQIHGGVTRDLSGGGLAAHFEQLPFHSGEQLVVMLRAEDADLVLPATVHWIRPEQQVVGFSFLQISQRDQDHLVRMVSLAEAARGR
jgi:hypothetical protein